MVSESSPAPRSIDSEVVGAAKSWLSIVPVVELMTQRPVRSSTDRTRSSSPPVAVIVTTGAEVSSVTGSSPSYRMTRPSVVTVPLSGPVASKTSEVYAPSTTRTS